MNKALYTKPFTLRKTKKVTLKTCSRNSYKRFHPFFLFFWHKANQNCKKFSASRNLLLQFFNIIVTLAAICLFSFSANLFCLFWTDICFTSKSHSSLDFSEEKMMCYFFPMSRNMICPRHSLMLSPETMQISYAGKISHGDFFFIKRVLKINICGKKDFLFVV